MQGGNSMSLKNQSLAESSNASKSHLFQPGQSGNPAGRPPGISPRQRAIRALNMIMDVFESEPNKRLFKKKLDEEFKRNPTKFYKDYIMYFIPKDGDPLTIENNSAFSINIIRAEGDGSGQDKLLK